MEAGLLACCPATRRFDGIHDWLLQGCSSEVAQHADHSFQHMLHVLTDVRSRRAHRLSFLFNSSNECYWTLLNAVLSIAHEQLPPLATVGAACAQWSLPRAPTPLCTAVTTL